MDNSYPVQCPDLKAGGREEELDKMGNVKGYWESELTGVGGESWWRRGRCFGPN